MIAPVHIIPGDVVEGLRTLPDGCVHCCVTSPPYWGLRDYGCDGQIGMEETPAEYLDRLVAVFREVRRVLRDDGTCWVNMGDGYASTPPGCGADGVSRSSTLHGQVSETYRETLRQSVGQKRNTIVGGLKPKDLIGMPWRLAFALQADGWWLRSDIIWAKKSPMPESVRDRPTKSHEYVFLLSKSERYFYDYEAVKEPAGSWNGSSFTSDYDVATKRGLGRAERTESNGRNMRSVWFLSSQPFTGWAETSHLVRVEAGAASDDTMRITSADCPVHEGFHDRVPKAFRDAHGADELIRSLGSADRLAQAREVDYAPTPQRREPGSTQRSSDSQDQRCFPPANGHSTRSNRTAPVPETTTPCTASARSPARTGGNGVARDPSDSVGRTPASSSEAGSASHGTGSSSDQTTDHSGGKCTCQHYSTENREMSHFATFPEALPERCIKAGTSEKGCCPACGAPWVRVVERDAMVLDRSERTHSKGHTRTSGTMVSPPSARTTGWRPSCECGDAPPVPCVVLDPFLGSGTTIAVARQLGRNGIGCELNPEYIELARERIGKAERPNTYRSTATRPAPLFDIGGAA